MLCFYSFFSTLTGSLTITHSTLSGNSASYGGAIVNGGTVRVANSTFSGNSATSSENSGAISMQDGTLTLTNSTFSGNSGGGIYYTAGTQLHLAGNIFAVGQSGQNCVNDDGGTLTDNGYNLSDDTTCTNGGAGSATNATLNLGALADNGGPTQTHLPGPASDAIGAIPNGTTISNNGTSWTCNQTFTDQRGESRPINSGGDCTAGAVEDSIPTAVVLVSLGAGASSSLFVTDGLTAWGLLVVTGLLLGSLALFSRYVNVRRKQ